MVTSQNGTKPEHTLTALVEDKPGVLNRITSMFRRRGYNIASLAVGPSEIPDLSRMTFVVEGDTRTTEQVSKNLNKLIDVIKVVDVDDNNSVWRELALVRVKWNTQPLSEIKAIVDIFGAKIVDTTSESLIIEVTGKSNKVNDLVDNLTGFGLQVQEVMRTGVVAMSRGSNEGDSQRRVRAERPAVKWESGSV
ncbi:MAG: acetolactate synthase small subunit [Dehalococcoidia bacterium]|nr:acetolactate synthase small subunit [Dehalococcoidia bacterium]